MRLVINFTGEEDDYVDERDEDRGGAFDRD
jgi:hypothetical protein